MSRRQSMHRQLVIKEGFLSRAPAGKLASLKTWERCWYVFGLQGLSPYLECYADPQAVLTGLSLERIELGACQQIVTKMITVDSRHPHSFNLILNDRVLCLAADTRNELSAWCRALQKKLEELGVLTPEHENVYEMQQPLSRLRQVSLQEQIGSDRSSVAGATTLSTAAPAGRRPRAATPLSNVSSDSGEPEATPQPAARPNGVRMENDFAPPRRPVILDNEEARRNVGRLLAVCTSQDGYDAGGCSCGSCGSCSASCECGRPLAVFNGQADATTPVTGSSSPVVPAPAAGSLVTVAPPATAAAPPAAAPRRSGSVAQAALSAVGAAVADVTRRTTAAGLPSLGMTPEASFRPIDAAPAPADRGSSHAPALPPVARPVAVSGAAGTVLPAAARTSSVAATDPFELRDLRQPQMQLERPPQLVDRASLDRAPNRVPERSESDFAVRRAPPVTHAAAAAPDSWDRANPLAATRLSLQQPQLPPRPTASAVPLEQQQRRQSHVTACVATAALPADGTVRPNADDSDAVPSVVMRRQRPAAKDDDANDAAGAYAMVVGRTLVATEGSDDDDNALYAVATNKTCLFGLDLGGGAATVENDYDLPPDEVVAARGQASRFSQVAAASSLGAAPAHATLTAASESRSAAASHVATVSRPLQESPSELPSSDRQGAVLGVSCKAALCSDVTGRMPRQQTVAKSEVNASWHVQGGDDDDSADFYDVGILRPSSVAGTVQGPDAGIVGRDGTNVPSTGRLAHGQSSYSEAIAADSSVEEALSGCSAERPPLPAKLAGRTSAVKPLHETAHSDRTVTVTGSAAKPVVATGCKKINSSGLAAESSEYQEWSPLGRHSTAEAKPPLPQRLHGSATGKSAQAVQQWLQATGAAASFPGLGSSSSSSSDNDDNMAEPAPARPPRIAPRTGGTLVFGGSMLKMPKPRPLVAARDGEAVGQQPIRQSQVEDLLREVNNAGGVKVNAYKKEVSGNICFVDVDNRVWIAGWNQKSQPLLQKLLHVGDEVLSLNHEAVTSSSMLYKNIRMGDNDRKLSFVLRRLPYATVLSIRRGYDGEDVGIRCQTGTPEVDVVVPGGLVHSSGLKPHASSPDSKRQCNWFLTEINNRPMSLFSKNGEVEPRLSAVGKDVMLVLQPVDFISKLKKQLKGQWGYKNYVVQ